MNRRARAASCCTPRTCTCRAPARAGPNGGSPSARTTPPTSRGCSAPCTAPSATSHDPQLLPGGTAQGRYAGSLIPLDFGERAAGEADGGWSPSGTVCRWTRTICPAGVRSPSSPGTLEELERRAANGRLDGCILKARVVSDDSHPRSGGPAGGTVAALRRVFELINTITNQPVKAIDPASEGDAEPALDELFREWRATAAKGVKAPHEAVGALFAQALGSAGQAAAADFGLTPLKLKAQETLNARSRRSGTGAAPDMRPLHLTIEGLRSFRTPARRNGDAAPRQPTIDFTGRDHVAIIGDTGAGKSHPGGNYLCAVRTDDVFRRAPTRS